MASLLANAVEFFKDIGLFDVILPFLLVFSIVYAILDKTRILGTEKVDDKDYPKRSLNSMVAFVIGLLVVAAKEVVSTINEALPNVVLLLIVSISFLLLISVFLKTEELDFSTKHSTWYAIFLILIFIGIIIIFLNSVHINTGEDSWLDEVFSWFEGTGGGGNMSAVGGSILFVIIAAAVIYFITKPAKVSGGK